jgi:hypothetical protein
MENLRPIMLIEVECHAGYRYPERPLSFRLQGKRFRVEQVLDTWYGEEALYFKVLAEDGLIYLLRYAPGQETWTLDGLFQPPGPRPEGERS